MSYWRKGDPLVSRDTRPWRDETFVSRWTVKNPDIWLLKYKFIRFYPNLLKSDTDTAD